MNKSLNKNILPHPIMKEYNGRSMDYEHPVLDGKLDGYFIFSYYLDRTMNNDSMRFFKQVSQTLFQKNKGSQQQNNRSSLLSPKGTVLSSFQQLFKIDNHTSNQKLGKVVRMISLDGSIRRDNLKTQSFSNSIRYQRANKI